MLQKQIYHYRAHELLKKKGPEDLGLEFTSVQRVELNGTSNFDGKPDVLYPDITVDESKL